MSDGLDYRILPTLSFVISMLIAFATGTVSVFLLKCWDVFSRLCRSNNEFVY